MCHKHQSAHHNEQEEDGDEGRNFATSLVVDNLVVDANGAHEARPDVAPHHKREILEEVKHPVDLQTTGGGTCAGANAHHQEGEREHKQPPSLPVAGAVARGGDGRNDVEDGVDGDALPTGVVPFGHNGNHHARIERHDDEDIGAEHIVLPETTATLLERGEDEAETDAAQEHEKGEHQFDVGRIEGGNAVVARREAAGGDGRETLADAFEKVHGTKPEHHNENKGDDGVECPQNLSRARDACPQFVVRDARSLSMKHDDAAAVVQGRDKGEGEDDDAQAAHPLRQSPPQ